jgi:hypothetical protein
MSYVICHIRKPDFSQNPLGMLKDGALSKDRIRRQVRGVPGKEKSVPVCRVNS